MTARTDESRKRQPDARVLELLSHRGGLASVVDRLYPPPSLLGRMGGPEVIGAIISSLYDGIESDRELKPMFRRDLSEERKKQAAFFEEWLGGRPRYTHHYAYNGLQDRHSFLYIAADSAGRWLGHMTRAVETHVADEAVRREFMQALTPIAKQFINETSPAGSVKVFSCNRLRPWKQLVPIVSKGDLATVKETCKKHPELLANEIHKAPLLLWHAAQRGHLSIVEYFVERGVGVNCPVSIRWNILLTPYCIARARKHDRVVDYLVAQGAVLDIFSCAYLGDRRTASQILERCPALINATDPACDVIEVTPLHHAAQRGDVKMVQWLFERGASAGEYSTAMVEEAADRNKLPLVRLLLENGADATRLGEGKWVKNRELANLLHQHGAKVENDEGDWIWFACTGNHGLRDDPELIEGLIEYGADVDARYRGATALHYSARAGFPRSMEVLIEHGANVNAVDSQGETPLFYPVKAKNKSDVIESLRVLLEHGADSTHRSHSGETAEIQIARSRRKDREEMLRLIRGT